MQVEGFFSLSLRYRVFWGVSSILVLFWCYKDQVWRIRLQLRGDNKCKFSIEWCFLFLGFLYCSINFLWIFCGTLKLDRNVRSKFNIEWCFFLVSCIAVASLYIFFGILQLVWDDLEDLLVTSVILALA